MIGRPYRRHTRRVDWLAVLGYVLGGGMLALAWFAWTWLVFSLAS